MIISQPRSDNGTLVATVDGVSRVFNEGVSESAPFISQPRSDNGTLVATVDGVSRVLMAVGV